MGISIDSSPEGLLNRSLKTGGGILSTPKGCSSPSSETEELLVSSTEGSSDPSRIKQRCQVIGEEMKEKEVKSERWVPKRITPLGPWARNDLTVKFLPRLEEGGEQDHVRDLSWPASSSPATPYSRVPGWGGGVFLCLHLPTHPV